MGQRLLTTAEVAAELRISTRALYRIMRDAQIEYLDLGHRTKRITREALDAYKERRNAASDTD